MAGQKFPFLAELLTHVFGSEGKKVRPAITLLASNFHPHESPNPAIMATAVEMLHIATLVHDDTVDNSDFRRGKATISSLWGRNTAVLVGDYIFAASATFVCDTGNVRVIRRFAETIMELSTGELQEMTDLFKADQTTDDYFKRIYNKTASLFTTASESGAILSGAPEDTVQSLRRYGYNLGMAFQIIDDILDFQGTQEEVGKPVGNDLLHGIVTMPSLLAMKRYPDDNPIRRYLNDKSEDGYLAKAIDMIQNSDVIEESHGVAKDFCHKAQKHLEALPKNAARNSLECLIEYMLDRRS
jgi:heptaprenyl diphosphate synthase/octaprenyl-diphosphate synthase